ncbi:putative trans-sialidase, Group V [Trypanosoma cruzi]|nr:putative trans-sialidase, Group V [Trypanosoma cruzi]
MHSRVAAVKAPRTHNRRRVTGSSGRRREGRESEPPRPNMSWRAFTSAVLLLLVVMWCGSGVVAEADGLAPGQESLPSPSFAWRDKEEGETVDSLHVPGLVEMDGDVFAVAEAQLKEASKSGFTGISSELLTLTDQESKELDTTKLKTQVLEECPAENKDSASQTGAQEDSQSRTKVRVSRPTTVVNGSDIYMFAGTYSFEVTEGVDQTPAAAKWGLLVASGKVSNDGSSDKKKIYWNDASVIPWTDFEKRHESLTRLIGGGGSGVQMKDGALVLPVEGTKDGKAVSLIIYSSEIGSGKLSKGMSADGCSDPSVVEREKGKLMMMTACDDGRRRVYESGDKGDSWTEALGTLSRVWGNNQKRHEKGVRSGFITANIDGVDGAKRTVMLVTLPVYSKEKGVLHLWLTDNTHIVDIGPLSGDDDVAASSLLYKSGDNKKEDLIALYEKKKGGGESSLGMVSVRLTAQLNRVKDVLTTWKEVDERVSKLCPSKSPAKNPSTGDACIAGKITDGLVGFLSKNFSDNTWRDEYLGVDATVKKGTNGRAAGYADGMTFRGAWAEWPVGSQGENQLYHFANHNFTLVATVSIHGVPRGDTPIALMGATMNDGKNTVLLGLSYDKEGKWQVLCGGKTTKELRSNWEPETTHQVAIVLRNGKQGSAYVDGQRVGDASCELKNTDSKGISHFYIGGDGGSAGSKEDVPVTATNVLLYNRPLDDNEIRVLNANKISIPKLTGLKTLAAGATGVGTARDGGAHGDGSTVCGGGLLPLLLLLGLWGIAAS